MSNGACCALEICCNAAEARAAFVKKFCEMGCAESAAASVTDYLREHYDFLPKGTIDLKEIIKMVKHHVAKSEPT